MVVEKGYVQVYTGNGKGKTTAALGISVRCACAGGKVLIGQFLKGQEYSELKIPDHFKTIVMKQFGTPEFVKGEPSDEAKQQAREGLEYMKKEMLTESYDMIVFDEINNSLDIGLLDIDDAIDIIDSKPTNTEIVFTGRGCPKEIIDRADLVTEMREIKHYYQVGVNARKGVEY